MFDWDLVLAKAKKVLIGALIAAGGAFLTWIYQWVSGNDLGVWTPLVVSLLSVLINALRKAGEAYQELNK